MDRQAVESSNVVSVGYDSTLGVLEVEFRNGGIYQYEEVAPETFSSLMEAESVGSFLCKNIIKEKYRVIKVEEE